MTPTAARPNGSKDSHWYTPEGEPCYSIMGKTTGRPRPVDIRDARANGYLPGVSTILKVLHKEALVNWMIEQAVLACLTTPRKMIKVIDPTTGQEIEATEPDDLFVERVLHVEKVQDEESQIARDKGTQIHDALEALFSGQAQPISDKLKPWVMPAYEAIKDRGLVITTEQILVGDGFAGRTDLILGRLNPESYEIWDFKSAKTLPDPKKGSWPEHRLQLSAYARAFLESQFAVQAKVSAPAIRTANLYISTVEMGKFVICEHSEWESTYWDGFVPLVGYWQWANSFKVMKRPVPEVVAEAPILSLGEPEAQAIIDGAAALAKVEPEPPPRKHRVAVDRGVPTIPQPRFAQMAPPPVPPEA